MTGSEHTIGDPAELAALYLAGAMTDHEQAAFEGICRPAVRPAIARCSRWIRCSPRSAIRAKPSCRAPGADRGLGPRER